MTDTQQKYFLTVSEQLSFSRAADKLYVSQPAVSKQIAALEAELGFELFDRADKTVHLTDAGKIFREFVLSYQRDLNMTINRIKNKNDSIYSGTVNIGCLVSWNGSYFYDRLASHFAMNYPGVKLHVVGYGLKEISEALRNGEIDVALVYGFVVEKQPDIVSKPLLALESGLLYSGRHFSSIDTSSGLAAFRNEHFLVSDNDGGNLMVKYISGICSDHGFTPHIKLCRRLPSAILETSCGSGVMLVDDWSSVKTNPAFDYLPLSHRIPVRIACMSKNPSPLTSLFVGEALYLFSIPEG